MNLSCKIGGCNEYLLDLIQSKIFEYSLVIEKQTFFESTVSFNHLTLLKSIKKTFLFAQKCKTTRYSVQRNLYVNNRSWALFLHATKYSYSPFVSFLSDSYVSVKTVSSVFSVLSASPSITADIPGNISSKIGPN